LQKPLLTNKINLVSELHKPKVAILASGEGTTAEAFILGTLFGGIDLEVPLVISDKQHPGVFSRVTALNKIHGFDIDKSYIGPKKYPNRRGEVAVRGMTLWQSEEMCKAVAEHDIDHVALMGFMQVVRGDLLQEYGYLPEYDSIYQARMSNTHPGPLPLTAGTFGVHASEKVLEEVANGRRKHSAHTVHLVSAGVDGGPVIARNRVDVEPDDTPETLFRRVQAKEKRRLPLDILKFLTGQAEYLGNS
jgi:phosphoribosylglycinamide formyltransferase 1